MPTGCSLIIFDFAEVLSPEMGAKYVGVQESTWEEYSIAVVYQKG